MKLSADIELKLRRFFRKYGKAIIVIFIIVMIILTINKLAGKKLEKPQTTYTPNVSVMDSSSKAPKKVHSSFEEFIDKYINYLNEKDYDSAYEMISEDCKNDYFGSFQDYVSYVNQKFYTKKSYAIQNYSNYNDKYIYSVKLFDDFLATGLTDSTYQYQEEKIVASYDENKNVVFSVGNFIEKQKLQSVQENQYLKADVKSKVVKYSFEEYYIKLTNRSDYYIIIQNSETEEDDAEDEIVINLGLEVRGNEEHNEIILNPGETKMIYPVFTKFYDDGDVTKSLILNSVRVVDEEFNEIDKFSMTLGF